MGRTDSSRPWHTGIGPTVVPGVIRLAARP
jgi:hypothetical protein